MSENSSSRLLKRYLAGSESAPFEIHERYQTRLVGLARKRLMGVLNAKIDPEDISQETFQVFFDLADRNEIQWRNEGDLWRLLAGITINKVNQKFDHYSAAKRNPKIEVPLDSSDSGDSSKDETAAIVLAELVEHILESEKPLTRSVVQLRLAGFTHRQIAEKAGRSTRTIRRVIDSLQARLIKEHDLGLAAYFESESKLGTHPVQFSQVRYEEFQLLKMVGQGSFAKVYVAKQIATGRLFAVKTIKKKWLLNSAVRQTFCDEAQLLRQLDHPNIVTYHGVGEIPNGGIFLLLEYVEGVTLDKAIVHAKPNQIESWANQITAAIEVIHAAGVMHGDLCMNNILVDLQNKIRIVDFGLGILSGDQAKLERTADLDSLESIKSILIANIK